MLSSKVSLALVAVALALLPAARAFCSAPAGLRLSALSLLQPASQSAAPHGLPCSVRALRRVSRNARHGAAGLVGLEFAQPEFSTYPQQVFTAVNFVVLPFWALMITTPKSDLTQSIMKGSATILLIAAMHLSLVAYGLSSPGSMEEFQFLATQGFVKLSAMMEMRQYPTFVSEEWAHVLGWDLFVGRFIYLDGLKKNIPTPHSLFFCFLLGPVGLTLHLLTRAAILKDPKTILDLE